MKNNKKGFALPIALLLLVVMSLMGATLVSISAGDIRANNEKDYSQQAFYAAESGITHAKKWMKTNSDKLKTQKNLNNQLNFCKTSFFPNLNGTKGFYSTSENLDTVIASSSNDEKNRLVLKNTLDILLHKGIRRDQNVFQYALYKSNHEDKIDYFNFTDLY